MCTIAALSTFHTRYEHTHQGQILHHGTYPYLAYPDLAYPYSAYPYSAYPHFHANLPSLHIP